MNNDSVFKITEKSDSYRKLVKIIMAENQITEAEAKAVIKKADLYASEKKAREKAEAKAKKAEAKLKEKEKELYRERNFFNIPASNTTRAIMNSLKAVNNNEDPEVSIDKLNNMQQSIDRRSQYIASIEQSDTGENLFIQYVTLKKNYEAEILLSFKNIFNFQKSSGNTAKFFLYLLAEINHRVTNRSREIVKGELELSTLKMAKVLNYSSSYEAKKAAKKAFENIADIAVKGYEIIKDSRGRTKKAKSVRVETYFHLIDVKTVDTRGAITVFLNKNIDWELLATSFTVIPQNVFALNVNAMYLSFYIAIICRINVDTIKKKGEISISMKSIAKMLYLPVDEYRYFSRYVKEPIDKAIETIENTCGSFFRMTPDYSHTQAGDETATGTDYLENTRLIVEPLDEYKAYFLEVAELKAKRQKTAKQWQQRQNTELRKERARIQANKEAIEAKKKAREAKAKKAE